MTAMRKVITTLLLYLLTSQEKVNSDVVLLDKTENITFDVLGEGKTFTWYKHDGDFFKCHNINKTFPVPSDGGIFTHVENETECRLQGNVSCKSHNLFIITSFTGNNTNMSESFTKKTGQNVTFWSQSQEPSSYILLWIHKRENVSKCIYSAEVTKTLDYVKENLFNDLCCSSNDIETENRIQLQNLSGSTGNSQCFHLDLVNLTSSDSGEYLCIGYSNLKWKLLNKYSLEVTKDAASTCGNETFGGDPNPSENDDLRVRQKETPIYIIAGAVGGFIAVLAIVFLSFLCFKSRGKQKNMTSSSPVDLPDEYECMPYSVSEQKEEMTNDLYCLAQNVVPPADVEYSEIHLTS